MVLRIITLLCCLSFSLMASAQASGGQITRKNNTTNKTKKQKTSSTNKVNENNTYKLGDIANKRSAQRVNAEEKRMIIKVFTTYFNALARLDESALSSTLSPVLNSFLHRANATKADVVLYMQKLHEPDITRMEFDFNNDWDIEKKEQGIERYSYVVTFTVVQNMERTEEGRETSTVYKVTAQVAPEGRITELNMKRWAPESSDGQKQESYSLSTSKGCYEQAKKLRMKGEGRQAIELYLKANRISESPYKTWALHQIGCIYYFGLGGVISNYYEAYRYFKMASDSGFLPSTYYLGVCYEYGRGVGKDVSKANYYYTKSGYSKAPGYDF